MTTVNFNESNTILNTSIYIAKNYYQICFDRNRLDMKEAWATIKEASNKTNKKTKQFLDHFKIQK